MNTRKDTTETQHEFPMVPCFISTLETGPYNKEEEIVTQV